MTERQKTMIGANQAHMPIVEDDAFLAHVVDEVGLVQLLCSVVHMTGKLDIIDGVQTGGVRFVSDGSGQIPPEQAAELRAKALDAIKAWRDAGCPEPYRPDDVQFRQMIEFLVGTDMGADYVPLVKEEMAFGGDARRHEWSQPVSQKTKDANPVLIIGAGVSGLVLAYRLKEAGIPVTVIEKNPGVGGTWHENRYPGCRVDVASHAYSFSFMQDYKWPGVFAVQSELQRYFDAFVERFGLRDLIELGTEVIRADYDEDAHQWAVVLRGPDGVQRTERTRSLVSAVGQLNRARIPEIPGLDDFAGRHWHTSNWPEDADLTGKNVVVVGAAATGVQAIPIIAEAAAHTTVVMRSPNWIALNPDYHRAFNDSEQWAFDHLPYFSGWTRALYFNWPFDRSPMSFRVDPSWSGGRRSSSRENDYVRMALTSGVERVLAGRPDLIEKLLPDYPPYMKRPMVTEGAFFTTFKRPDVTLTDGIAKIVPDGVIDADGAFHKADVIVFATGFHAQKFLFPMTVCGRDKISLQDYWGEEPSALYGMTVPYFPNFYMMYGPNTNLGFNGTLIFHSECQTKYIVGNICRMIAEDLSEIEVRESVYLEYDALVQETMHDFVWKLEHTNNWYKNDNGRITTNSPWPCLKYWRWTREPDPRDFLEQGEQQSRTVRKTKVA